MSAQFDLESGRGKTLTVSRYVGPVDGTDDRIRYSITDVYGKPADCIAREDLAQLAAWIVAELNERHREG